MSPHDRELQRPPGGIEGDEELRQAASLACHLISRLAAKASPQVKKILGQIREHFLEAGCTVSEIRHTLGLNDNYVVAAFRAEVSGFTIRGFIRQCRLLTAACLLRDTSRPLAQITLDVGYDDTEANLSKHFHEWCGLYPRAYRRHARKLLRQSGHAPEEVFTWSRWRRACRRELEAGETRLIIRFLERLAPTAVAVAARQRRSC